MTVHLHNNARTRPKTCSMVLKYYLTPISTDNAYICQTNKLTDFRTADVIVCFRENRFHGDSR